MTATILSILRIPILVFLISGRVTFILFLPLTRMFRLFTCPFTFSSAVTNFVQCLTLPCCVSGTFSIRSGLLAPVHSSATDDTRGRFLWRFFLLITGISMTLFYQMKQEASVRRTYKKEMVVARSTLVHLRHHRIAEPKKQTETLLTSLCDEAISELKCKSDTYRLGLGIEPSIARLRDN